MSIVLPASAPLPSRSARPSRAARTAGLALALALGLSGCGAGLRAQTYQERTTSDSTNEAIGAIAIRNIRVLPPTGDVEYARGSDARVGLVVVNEGDQPDRLTTVTSDAAGRVEVLGPDGRPASLTTEPNSATSGFVLVLRGLTRDLRPGQFVQMELTFAESGSETMLVPVELTGTPGPKREGYEIGETDSTGKVLVHEEGEGAEGGEEAGPEGGEEVESHGGEGAGGESH